MRHILRKRNIERTVAAFLVVLLILPIIPTASAAEASGTCGNGVSWSLESGVLIISGKGNMRNYGEFSPAPWSGYADSIRSVRVENGVTAVGDFAFFQMDQITSVTLADSVKTIGGWAFYECTALEMLDLGGGVTSIGESAFELCANLMSVKLPDTLNSLGDQAFYRCSGLKSITVPSSVTQMGTETFAYCYSLLSATVHANLSKLPVWTFYGCYQLSSVTLSSNISSVGEGAFEHCDKLPESFNVSDESTPVDYSTTTEGEENGQKVITESHYTEQSNSSINVQTTQIQSGNTTTVETQVDAILDNAEGWAELEDRVDNALHANNGTVQVNVSLKGNSEISGSDLGLFAGKDVEITIHTQQGAYWHVNGKDLTGVDIKEAYRLSFALYPLTDPTEEQTAAVGKGTSFAVVFDSDIDFKVEVQLPLGGSLARDTAVFFSSEEEGYARMQATVIDGEGIAHFYLGQVQADTEYLIGINVPDSEDESGISDAIIPEVLQNEYPQLEQVEEIEYIVTGVKSSWDMDLGQVTTILAVVMVSSVIIVGIVVYALFKRKLKKGYVPDMRYEDEVESN